MDTAHGVVHAADKKGGAADATDPILGNKS